MKLMPLRTFNSSLNVHVMNCPTKCYATNDQLPTKLCPHKPIRCPQSTNHSTGIY